MTVRFARFTFLAVALALPLVAGAATPIHVHPEPDHAAGAFVIAEVDGQAYCREATPDEALMINARNDVPVKIFGEKRSRLGANHEGEQHGLNIILRGTEQLDANPEAKAAFERAAAIWEARIANPITVYVDVDYGPTRFGTAYPSSNIIGSTGSASWIFDDGDYELVLRPQILLRADSPLENTIYQAFPANTLPTDAGPVSRFGAASLLLRAFDIFPANADDDLPSQAKNRTPTIGFNSGFSFDFDPSDGIAAGKTDFVGVAVHEMGHMLGFVSRTGIAELGTGPQYVPGPAILDLFRFRPGVDLGSFATAERITKTGGDQIFFAGSQSLALSTGNPRGENGDGQQASHWKDDGQTGNHIGIMDPTIPRGRREELTRFDLEAFDIMGYTIVSNGCSELEPNNVSADANAIPFDTACSGTTGATEQSATSIPLSGGATGRVQDIFRVTLPAPAKLNVTLDFSNASADLDLFLLDFSGGNAVVTMSSTGNTTTERFETEKVPAGTYYIAVASFSGTSPYTITVNPLGLPPPPPAAPSRLAATAISSSALRLTWVDNATNEGEFRIEQKNASGTFVEIATAPANATSFEVTGLGALTTSTYRIRARNAGGDSQYSAEATGTTGGGTGACVPSANTVCLLSDRFKVYIDYLNQFATPPQAGKLVAQRLLSGVQNPDTALFGFGSPQAVEVVVRIQDTRPFGASRFDIYFGGMTDVEYTVTVVDTVTGTTRQYRNPPGVVGGGVDRASFPTNGAPTPVYGKVDAVAVTSAPVVAPNAQGACVASDNTVCLLDGRFKVKIDYLNQFTDPPQPGTLLGQKLIAGVQNPDTGIFGFGSPQAIEAVVRIQDARPFNINRFDIYFGGMTDVEYTVTVTDTVTGTTRQYRKGPGSVAGGVDRSSFPAN